MAVLREPNYYDNSENISTILEWDAKEKVKRSVEELGSKVFYQGYFPEENDYNIIFESSDWDFFIDSIKNAEPDKYLCELLNKPLKFKRNV